MRIALHDIDRTDFPNLALMKLSAWHKGRGDVVDWYDPLWADQFDRVYSAKVFTFTPDEKPHGRDVVRGGTGHDMTATLPDEVEHICPDYSLHPDIKASYGFLTRGCPNRCPWCIVPSKEGEIRPHADIEEFLKHRDVILMDNNVLASGHGIEQIEKMARLGVRVDFNQGLDARLIDDGMARRLSKLKWHHPLRLACDQKGQMGAIQRAVTHLRWHNVTPVRYFVYVLVKDVDDAVERVRFLKGMNLDPFAQPYIDVSNPESATREQRDFARWCNMRSAFKSTTWENYRN